MQRLSEGGLLSYSRLVPEREGKETFIPLGLRTLGGIMGDLLKPTAPHVLVRVNHCANCARYLPSELCGLEDQLCNYCKRITEFYAQLWECEVCGTLRMWGEGTPYETSPKVLGCISCHLAREHRFAYVNRTRGERVPLNEKQEQMRERISPKERVRQAIWRT